MIQLKKMEKVGRILFNRKIFNLLMAILIISTIVGVSNIDTYAQESISTVNPNDMEIRTSKKIYDDLEKNNPEYLKNLFGIDYLESEIPQVNLSPDKTIYPDLTDNNSRMLRSKASRMLRSKAIGWEIYSKKAISTHYGAWRDGPSGRGPSRLSINSSTTFNRAFTNSISGSYPIGEGQVGASLGVTIGKAKTYGTSYSIKIPKGKRQQIIFRSVYKRYEVKQRYYAKGTLTGKKATCYVDVFSHWDYDFKNI